MRRRSHAARMESAMRHHPPPLPLISPIPKASPINSDQWAAIGVRLLGTRRTFVYPDPPPSAFTMHLKFHSPSCKTRQLIPFRGEPFVPLRNCVSTAHYNSPQCQRTNRGDTCP